MNIKITERVNSVLLIILSRTCILREENLQHFDTSCLDWLSDPLYSSTTTTSSISSSSIQPLGQFGQEPEPCQATAMALVAASWTTSYR